MSDPWFLDPQNADARRTIDTRLTEDRSDNGATQQSQAAHRRAYPIDAASRRPERLDDAAQRVRLPLGARWVRLRLRFTAGFGEGGAVDRRDARSAAS